MGQLIDLIQRHLDRYGVKHAEFARRIGATPSAVYSWKRRGVKQLPDKQILEGITEVTGFPYWQVLEAALIDSGYRDPRPNARELCQRLRDMPIEDCREIAEFVAALVAEHDAELPDRFHDPSHTAGSATRVKTLSSPETSGVYQPSPWVEDLLDAGERGITSANKGERARMS
ncbi:hypothetical protein [Nocardia sp. NPDC051570]|uniref:hypothetical protein n=1 Tax=Nocardia sp. NPDC051570 TaxID=3364324 RepID=UPI00379EF503